MLVMSKRKASYDLTFKLKAVKCTEERPRKQLLVNSMLIHAEKAKLSWRLPGSFSTENSSPIPGVHMYLYTWWPPTTLSFEKYYRS